MFIIVPYKTDAADRVPWGTVGLIVANFAVVLLLGFPRAGDAFVNSMVLSYGAFNPLTWISNTFVHLDWGHLLGNMIFLGVFGLIAEGLLGWWRFLLAYLAVGCVASMVIQLVMLGADAGGAAGASDAIYGLMAMSLLWAPRNKVTVWMWFFSLVRSFEVSVAAFAMIWISLDLFVALVTGFRVGTEVAHLLGAAGGLALGYALLRHGIVDCDGWDYLSLQRHGRPRAVVPEASANPVAPRDPRVTALVRVRDALDEGDGPAADAAYRTGQAAAPNWVLGRSDLIALIRLLEGEPALARMEELIRAYPDGADGVRLAHIDGLLRANRPTPALEWLAVIDDRDFTDTQRATKARLESRANAALRSGTLELE